MRAVSVGNRQSPQVPANPPEMRECRDFDLTQSIGAAAFVNASLAELGIVPETGPSDRREPAMTSSERTSVHIGNGFVNIDLSAIKSTTNCATAMTGLRRLGRGASGRSRVGRHSKPSSTRPDFWMTSRLARCALGSSPSAITSAMPSTPFIGVRISWLIMPRKTDLARLASRRC